MKMWPVPTPGARPHDPLATADGALWYTGQMNNMLGRRDLNTGAFKEYPLTTPHSGPHGLVEDKGGNVWYTGNTGALVGKLDPKTGAVVEYKMPDPDVKCLSLRPTVLRVAHFFSSQAFQKSAGNARKLPPQLRRSTIRDIDRTGRPA